jgi:hypothetical protein
MGVLNMIKKNPAQKRSYRSQKATGIKAMKIVRAY